MSLFKRNAAKDQCKPARIKNIHGGGKKPRKLKMQKQSEDKIIINKRNLFKQKKRKMTQSKTE